MLGGFAVIAWPVRWGETGMMTFIVSHNSDVYEKDLGLDTAQATAINTRHVVGQGGHDAGSPMVENAAKHSAERRSRH